MIHVFSKLSIVCVFLFPVLVGCSQGNSSHIPEGTFVSQDLMTNLQIRISDQIVEGVLYEQSVILPFRGTTSNGQVEGKIYSDQGLIPFEASWQSEVIKLDIEGEQMKFYKTSDQHELAKADFQAFFKEQSPVPPEEPVTTASSSKSNGGNKYEQLNRIISGGQLTVFIKGSLVSDNSASSISYFNFCPNGTFNISTDASYSVEGNYGGNVHGGGKTRNHGQWQITEHEGVTVVKMMYADGDIVYNPVDFHKLQSGRWKQGNRQYAFLRNKAVCR